MGDLTEVHVCRIYMPKLDFDGISLQNLENLIDFGSQNSGGRLIEYGRLIE